eukprot:15344737-Ditylum_brightwellii.AAC.1
MIKNDKERKYRTNTYKDLYQIAKVNNNGTVHIKSRFSHNPEYGQSTISTQAHMFLGILCPTSNKCKCKPA